MSSFLFKKRLGILPIIIALIAIVLVILSATLAAVFWGDRTGVGNGNTIVGTEGPTSSEPPVVPVDGTCPQVRTMGQYVKNWCGVAAASQVVAFWKGNYSYYASKSYMSKYGGEMNQGILNRDSGKSYRYTNSAQEVVNSLKSGKPVIAYTAIYGQHIIVLTCYDEATQTFTANDSEPKDTGKQSVQVMGGVRLTLSNLTGLYSGHSKYPSHPMFLVSN